MTETTSSTKNGFMFLLFALLAFGGLGLEMLLAFLIEPLIYGVGLSDFSTAQLIFHWIITCITWGVSAFILLFFAKRVLDFDVFSSRQSIRLAGWAVCLASLALCVAISIIDWKGFKPAKEFAYNGGLKFTFQYLYYIFETVLVYLIVVFAQEAGEKWFKQDKIPYGGIFAALTWGMIHWLTQGSLTAGLLSLVFALLFGVVYIFAKKNTRIAFPLILLMLIL